MPSQEPQENISPGPQETNGITEFPSAQTWSELVELIDTANIPTMHFDEAPSTNAGLDPIMLPVEPEIAEMMGFAIGDAETAQPPSLANEPETDRDGECETRPVQDNAGSTARRGSEEVRTTQAVSFDKAERPTISDVNGK